MTTNDHIAAIKEHLKAIEAEKPKEPKRYLVIPVECESTSQIVEIYIYELAILALSKQYVYLDDVPKDAIVEALRRGYEYLILSGQIITVNE